MAYDAQRRRVVLFAGNEVRGRATGISDTWEWDGSTWSRLVLATDPPERMHHAMAYDDVRERVVVFGGFNNLPRGDTFELTAQRGVCEPFGAGCAGAVGVPGLRPDFLPEVGRPFRLHLWQLPGQPGAVLVGVSRSLWHGLTLPLDLGALGMPGCTLHVSGEWVDALAASPLRSRTWGFDIPDLAVLVGVQFFNQACFLDPTANPAGVVLTNATRSVVGR